MKIEQNESTGVDRSSGDAKSPSRRAFLRTSSATALVTSLAAQPVWGQCTVSGAMSGGSQSTDDNCLIPPPLFGAGRSPGFWSDAMYKGNAVSAAFPGFRDSDRQELRCYIDAVKANNFYTIPATPTTSAKLVNVANELLYPGTSGGSNNWNLAAIWLNAYFGFFDGVAVPGLLTTPTPQDWVNHFFGLYMLGGDSVFSSIFTGEPSTAWWTDLTGNSFC